MERIGTTKSGRLRRLVADDRAQDAFEYLLVVGGVTVGIIALMAAPVGGALIDSVVSGTCAAIATVVPSVVCA